MLRATVALAALVLACVLAVPAPAQATRGALVRLPYAYEGTLTPYTFANAYGLVTLVYDTLLWRDADGIPRPWLARTVRMSADGRRLSVRLARGARWQDGRPVTAADVAFTFAHLRANPHPRFTPQLRALEGVTVTGRDRLVIRLRRPSPGFLDQPLADVPILPRHIWAGLARGAVPPGLPVGSGPYRLVRAGPDGYRFVADDRWFGGRPAVREIRTVPLASPRAVSRALDSGRIDLAAVPSTAGSEGLLDAPGRALERGPSYLGTVLMFNLRRPPSDSARLRRAVARALGLPAIARAAAGSGAAIEPAEQGLLHPRSRWAPRADLHELDVAAARTVLARPDAPALRVLAARDDPPQRAAGRAVVAALRRAGARATLVERPAARVAAAVGQDRPAGQDFDLAIWSIPPLASHDPDYLRTVFGRGGPLNYSGYDSAAFERLADRVATARPAAARRAAVAGELRLLARDLPAVPLFFQQAAFVSRRAAWDGWRFVAGDGVVDKRSFVAGPSPRRRPAPASAPAADSAGSGVLGYVALGLLGLALSVVLIGSPRGRRRAR
jgi:peptide/nickel transport system substrate-binding protein